MSPKRRPKSALGEWITKSTFPIYVVDSKYRIRYVNRGCEVLTRLDAVDLVGKQCRYSSEPTGNPVDLLLGAMCPPASTFQGELQRQSITMPVLENSEQGDSQHVFEANFIPIIDTDGDQSAENSVSTIVVILFPEESNDKTSRSHKDTALHAQLLRMRSEIRQCFSFDSLIGKTPIIRSGLRTAKVASQCLDTVHLFGDRGTGKLHWARAIHQQSPNQERSFVPMDCRRLSSVQIRRILKRLMMFHAEESSEEMAPGTIFFSHVDHLALDLQVEVRELFESTSVPIRLMSSSIKDLARLAELEEFDEELFHMVSTLSIRLPTLVERHDDLPLLAQSMLERINRETEKQMDGFSAEVMQEFQRYAWPANLTELNIVVREAHKKCQSTTIERDDLPFRFNAGIDAQSVGPAKSFSGINLEEHLQKVEVENIRLALETAKQNKTKAAQLLGLTRAKLYRRMEQLGITDAD